MLFRRSLLHFCLAATGLTSSLAAANPALQAALSGPQRAAEAKARDVYRHPQETLSFFDIAATATVVEISPGGGYWTEILAPYLKDKGKYIAAVGSYGGGVKGFTEKFAAKPDVYGKMVVTEMNFAPPTDLAPAGTADFVLTFRNVHNWMKAGTADAAFAAFFKALKPGGILGLEEHRAPTSKPQDPEALSGYVREDYVIDLAKKAGFELADKAEINANPKDTKDYKDGVWTLPPTLKLGEQDKAKYLAIGESDRMTLKFRKPAAKK